MDRRVYTSRTVACCLSSCTLLYPYELPLRQVRDSPRISDMFFLSRARWFTMGRHQRPGGGPQLPVDPAAEPPPQSKSRSRVCVCFLSAISHSRLLSCSTLLSLVFRAIACNLLHPAHPASVACSPSLSALVALELVPSQAPCILHHVKTEGVILLRSLVPFHHCSTCTM